MNIINATLIATWSGIMVGVTLWYFKQVVKVYPPNIKKHVSFMKKSFRFSIRYILPIVTIAYLMVFIKITDKWFVFFMCLNTFFLLFNILFEMLLNLLDHHRSGMALQGDTLKLIDMHNKKINSNSEAISELAEIQRKIIDRLPP